VKRIQYLRYGGPETMHVDDFDLAGSASGEAAVRVVAAAINPIDWKIRSGELKMMTGRRFPRAMGSDFAGVVQAIGPGVTTVKPGDEVFGITNLKPSGAFAETVINPASQLAIKPATLSFEQAASLATPGVMALSGLVDSAHVKSGDTVFVNGCTGGVGEAVVQVARMLGARVAGSCSAKNMPRARELGVETIYDYAAKPGPNQFGTPGAYDVVYDTAGTLAVKHAMRMVKRNGIFLDINARPSKFIHAAISRRHKLLFCKPTTDLLARVAQTAIAGHLTMTIGQTVTLETAPKLIASLEHGQAQTGKGLIVLEAVL
jgi:NADPH:quinone reductase-like Zn-dependent oxidoreductase